MPPRGGGMEINMQQRYGKDVDMRSIKRDLENVKDSVIRVRKRLDRYNEICEKRKCCPMCGVDEGRIFITIYEKYRYYQCENCGGLYLAEYPSTEEMYSSYDMDALFDEYISDDIFAKRVEMISKPKVEWILEVCKDNSIRINSWLDIGCGGGEILYYLAENTSVKTTGLESNPLEVDFARNKGLNIYKCFIVPSENRKEITDIICENDCVSAINMLEHVENPVEFINYFYDNMKDNSILVFEVPKHPALASFANLTSKDNIYRHITAPVHLQIFSLDAINLMLEGKFEIIAMWEFGQGFNDLLHNAMILSGQEENELYIELQKHSNKIQKAIDESGFGDQIIVVAKKK